VEGEFEFDFEMLFSLQILAKPPWGWHVKNGSEHG